MSRPMNDEEVLSEMKKMVAFIRQEATEKAREIQVKADEEFAIEKVCADRDPCELELRVQLHVDDKQLILSFFCPALQS